MLTAIALIVVFELVAVAAALRWLAKPGEAIEPEPVSAIDLDRPTLLAAAVAVAAVIAAPMFITIEPKPAAPVAVPVAADGRLFPSNNKGPSVDLIDEQTGKRVTVPLDIPQKK